jgi:hypothetical protein
MKSGGIVALAIVAVFACVTLDNHLRGAEQDSFEALSPLLPTSRDLLFSLSIAEVREAVTSLEQRVQQGQGSSGATARCDKPEPVPEVAEQVKKDLSLQKAQQDNLDSIFQKIRDSDREVEMLRGKGQALQKKMADQKKGIALAATTAKEDESSAARKMGGAAPATTGPSGEAKEATKKEIKSLKEQSELDQRELDGLPSVIFKAERQAKEGRDQLREEMTQTDSSGLTWLAKALISENEDFLSLIRRIGAGQQGTLKTEIVKASAAGRTNSVRGLLESGADIDSHPGEYSALAYAKVFGFKQIGHMLEQNGATVQVPWDPNREESIQASLTIMEKQLNRLSAFAATLVAAGGSMPRLTHDIMVLDWIKCRFEACKTAAGRKPEVAANKRTDERRLTDMSLR